MVFSEFAAGPRNVAVDGRGVVYVLADTAVTGGLLRWTPQPKARETNK